jgi:hypothetical protein
MHDVTQMIDLVQRAKALSGQYENVVLNRFNDHAVRMSRMDAILCQLKQVLAIKGSAGVRCYVDRAQLQNLLNVSLEAG